MIANRGYTYDAFGNALGNSIVQGIQSKPKPKVQDPDTGKSSPSLVGEFDVMEAAAAQKQKAVDLSQQQNTYVNTTVEDLGAAYFAENPLYSVNLKTDLSQFEFGSSTNSGFTINQDIMNGVDMPSIVHSDYQLDSGLASGNGLTLEQVRKASLQMITHWDQPLMLPAYDPNFELTGGAKLMLTSAANQAYQRNLSDRQQAFFGGGRPEAWHMPVSQTLTNVGLSGGLVYSPSTTLLALGSLAAADDLFIHREAYSQHASRIYNEAQQNGGITIPVGITPSFSIFGIQGAAALGGWMSYDFSSGNFNGGGYYSFEGGPKIGQPNIDFDLGYEVTAFTTSDFDAALSGNFEIYSGSYNNSSISYIKAGKNNSISGYQYTWDSSERAKSIINIRHDANGSWAEGYGNYFKF